MYVFRTETPEIRNGLFNTPTQEVASLRMVEVKYAWC